MGRSSHSLPRSVLEVLEDSSEREGTGSAARQIEATRAGKSL